MFMSLIVSYTVALVLKYWFCVILPVVLFVLCLYLFQIAFDDRNVQVVQQKIKVF